MVSYITRLAALAAVLAPAIFAAPTPELNQLKIRNYEATDVVENSYIVVYNDDITAASIAEHVAHVSGLIAKRDVAGIGATYDMDHLKGYQLIADTAIIAEIAASPDVAYIEKDARVYLTNLTTQASAPYGLSRISHKSANASNYVYDDTAGDGVTVYVVDTGVYAAHAQFEGRATMGQNFIANSANTDENGHGTHVSGTIAGTTYGVAKKASIVGVKVLDKTGSGSNSGVISGIQWVGNNAKANSILSMSLGGSVSTAVNAAAKSAFSKGVTVIVAAGNDNDDAKYYSPASEPTAITVGAIDGSDKRASFSNFGALVDIFGPGVNIVSSWIGSTTATKSISGTSMATPHIAGLAAYLISLEKLTSPTAVDARLKALAISGKITGAKSTNNLIAYNGSGS